MRGEVDGVSSGTSKRKRHTVGETDGTNSGHQVRYRRTSRADKIEMSELPSNVLEDVTNLISYPEAQGEMNPKSRSLPSVAVARSTLNDENSLAPDTTAYNNCPVNECHAKDLSMSGLGSHISPATKPKSDVLSYIERSRHRAEKVLLSIGVSSDVTEVVKTPSRFGHGQMLNCDMSNNLDCRSLRLRPIGEEKRLTSKSVNKIIRDLSHHFSATEESVAGKLSGAETDSIFNDRQRNTMFDDIHPLSGPRRVKMLSNIMNSESAQSVDGKLSVAETGSNFNLRTTNAMFDDIHPLPGPRRVKMLYDIMNSESGCQASMAEQCSKRDRRGRDKEFKPLRRSKRFLYSFADNDEDRLRLHQDIANKLKDMIDNYNPIASVQV
ncbi:hypothetical protein RIF29_29705 [Crotalaria pallida]|uniref:Uncharacterized protein n=1 Tax=Crotalaria pallida TaxID=3830 RepID=A0AAN9EFY0_CROPI